MNEWMNVKMRKEGRRKKDDGIEIFGEWDTAGENCEGGRHVHLDLAVHAMC
jgi:hypothetical protein